MLNDTFLTAVIFIFRMANYICYLPSFYLLSSSVQGNVLNVQRTDCWQWHHEENTTLIIEMNLWQERTNVNEMVQMCHWHVKVFPFSIIYSNSTHSFSSVETEPKNIHMRHIVKGHHIHQTCVSQLYGMWVQNHST